MQVKYKNKKIEKICTDASTARKKYGFEMACKIQQRVDELKAAVNVEMMLKFGIGRCHPLVQNRYGQYALDLVHPYRLVFTVSEEKVQIANILEITDYH